MRRAAEGIAAAVVVVVVVGVRSASGVPWEQQAKLLGSDEAANDAFGISVAVSGTTAMVGACWDDDRGEQSGSVFVFDRDGAGWTQTAKLTAADGPDGGYFGFSVALDGSAALVGAYGDDPHGYNSGSAYVFENDGAGWVQARKLIPDDGAGSDNFGHAVALNGNTALIGAVGDDDHGNDSGSACVYRKGDTGWTQTAKLLADDGAYDDHFGIAVALDGDTAVVGAYQDDSPSTSAGSAYVFARDDAGWTQVAKLVADDAEKFDNFGYTVAVSGDTILVGAPGEGRGGAAYFFERGDSGWTQVAKVFSDELNDAFGVSVALDGDTALIGAYHDNDRGYQSGSAFVYELGGSGWTLAAKLLASDGASSDEFGRAVALDGGTAVIGAYLDDDVGLDSGSAYTYQAIPEPATLALLALGAAAAGLAGRRRRGR